jgi:hypothetical protein
MLESDDKIWYGPFDIWIEALTTSEYAEMSSSYSKYFKVKLSGKALRAFA